MPIPVLEGDKVRLTYLKKALVEEDRWPLEVVAARIEKTLEEAVRAFFAGSPGPQEVPFLAGEFRGTPLQAEKPVITSPDFRLQAVAGPAPKERTVTREAFRAELRRLLEGYRSLKVVSFRVTAIYPDPSDSRRVKASIQYELAGSNQKAGPQQDQGRWATEWLKQDQTWSLLWLDSVQFLHQDSRDLLFRDVTSASLGRNSAFHGQLNRGAEYWLTHLDAASGMDFYRLDGIAAGDFDGDGWEDVYVCQPGGLPNRLFRNRGDGTFEDVTAQTGLDILDPTAAALWADFDNDGDQDLFLIGHGILLFENDGRGHFSLSSQARFEIPREERGTMMSGALADYDRDGFLDLYVCQYSPSLGSSTAGYLHQPTPYHDANNGPPNQLFRNNGDGTFTNVTEKSGLNVNNRRWSFAVAWGDYDNDGYPDIYVANDFGRNNLYRNNQDGTFTDVAAEAGVEDVAAGMSTSWEDYDNDGRLDLYISNIWSASGQRLTDQSGFQPAASADVRRLYQRFSKGNTLYKNLGEGRFEETTFQAGVANGGWAWGSDFFDLNNDGREDLYVVNGYITNDETAADLESFHWRHIAASSPLQATRSRRYDESWRTFQNLMREAGFSTHARERNRLFLNAGGGEFIDVSGTAGLDFQDDGRAFAIVDFDNDGDLDLINKNRSAPEVRVLRNELDASFHSVAFELAGTQSNRDAVGAKVRLKTGDGVRVKTVESGSGFLSQHTRRLYFGLGRSTGIESVEITWPAGLTQEFTDLPADHIIRIEEGKSHFTAKPFRPKARQLPPGPVENTDPVSLESDYRGIWLLERVPMPDHIVLDEAGGQHSLLTEAKGRVTIVNFWSEECRPCRAEAEQWKALVNALPLQTILRVSVESRSALPASPAEPSANLKTYRSASPRSLQVVNTVVKHLFARRRDLGLPFTLILDERGYLAKIYRGTIQSDWIREDVQRFPRTLQDQARLALPFPGKYYKDPPDRQETYFWIAYDCLEAEFYDEALQYFQECLKLNPQFGRVHNNIGTIYLRQGRLDDALTSFQRALALEPELAEIRFNMGTALAMKGDLEQAVSVLSEASRMDPSDADIWNNLGNAYLNQGRLDEAKASLERALELNPGLAEAHNNLGIIHGQFGRLEQAFEHFEQAVRLQPNLVHGYLNLGLIYLHREDRSKALEMFQKVLELDPSNAEARQLVEQLRGR